jgi:hypothetical protein
VWLAQIAKGPIADRVIGPLFLRGNVDGFSALLLQDMCSLGQADDCRPKPGENSGIALQDRVAICVGTPSAADLHRQVVLAS